MRAFKSKFACKATKSDFQKRIRSLSQWMINPNPKGRPTARQALAVLQKTEGSSAVSETEKTSGLLKSLQLNNK